MEERDEKKLKFESVGINQSLTQRILSAIQLSVQSILLEDFDSTDLLIDSAWEMLPERVRLSVPMRPSERIDEVIQKGTPTRQAILNSPPVLDFIKRALTDYEYEKFLAENEEANYLPRQEIRIAWYQARKAKELYLKEHGHIRLEIMRSMDKAGMLMESLKTRITPTSEEEVAKQPPLEKVEPLNARFS